MTTPPDIALNPSDLEHFYTNYFSYYNGLARAEQLRFVERCIKFISEKDISGAADFKPDNRVKALIAASAVQLTLGLETWNLSYFDEIELHTSDFEGSYGNQKFKGETHLHGYIRLSWTSFIHGYKVNDDGINLGLHEFSHALRFNGIKGHPQDYFVDHYFNKWLACANDAFQDMRQKRNTIFRAYGAVNINEFLSVCIEHYFESPAEIKENYPLLYYATGILLNQESAQGKTRINVRNELLSLQNNLLPGFEPLLLQSSFLKHWTFKLWGFLFLIVLYTASTSGILNPITLALTLMFLSVFLWYHYIAVKLDFKGHYVLLEKGALLFRKRKTRTLLVSEVVSVRKEGEEWAIIYYDQNDLYFYEEKIHPPEGVNEAFMSAFKRNKIAVPA